jgi:hypothetical protein
VYESARGGSTLHASRRRNLKPTGDEASVTIPQDSTTSENSEAEEGVASCDVLPRSAAASEPNAVEMALARALTEASAAGRFDVVVQLARELEARRVAKAPGMSCDSMCIVAASGREVALT